MENSYTAQDQAANESWLKKYYFVRAAFSAVWVVLALSLAAHSSSIAAILLVSYPLWDALANLSYEWLDGTVAQVSGAAIANASDRLWGEVALGGTLGLGRVTLYTQASGTRR